MRSTSQRLKTAVLEGAGGGKEDQSPQRKSQRKGRIKHAHSADQYIGELNRRLAVSNPSLSLSCSLSRMAIREHIGEYYSATVRTRVHEMFDARVLLSEITKDNLCILQAEDDSFPLIPGKVAEYDILDGKFLLPEESIALFPERAIEIVSPYDKEHVYTVCFHNRTQEAANEALRTFERRMKESSITRGNILDLVTNSLRRRGNYERAILNDDTERSVQRYIIPYLDLIRKGNAEKLGIIMGGPPGTGKTTLANQIVQQAEGFTAIWLPPHTLESPASLRMWVGYASSIAPIILVMEDIDTIGLSREHIHSVGLGAMLNELGGSKKLENILILGTTNRYFDLDSALIRPGRFDVLIDIGLPERQTIEKYLRNLKVAEDYILDIAKISEGSTQAEIQAIVRRIRSGGIEITSTLYREEMKYWKKERKGLKEPEDPRGGVGFQAKRNRGEDSDYT